MKATTPNEAGVADSSVLVGLHGRHGKLPNPAGAALREPDPAAVATGAILFALGQMVEQRDRHTAAHGQRMAFISVAVGQAMGLERSDLVALYYGSYLHDIGKVGIPDSILFKPAALTAEEWNIMRTHPLRGAEICRHLEPLHPVLPMIRSHHERLDGSGYPDGLKGEEIPLLARVVQIVDIYDALINPRPYKKALASSTALGILEEEAGKGWRDRALVRLFTDMHDQVIARAGEFAGGNDSQLEALNQALTVA